MRLCAAFLLCLGLTIGAAAWGQLPPVQPVAALDLARYQGNWYEIARFPNAFQAACAGGVSAQYSALPDGTVRVLNRCRKADGSFAQVVGEARPDARAPQASARLQVRFAPAWLSWLPLVWAPYWVIVLDPDYRYAVVSEPERKYLWVLSRTPTLDQASYAAILAELVERGYDLSKLEKTVQP